MNHCKGIVAHYKIPKYMYIVDEYPLTVTGKVRKNVIRDNMNDLLREGKADLINGLSPAK